MRQEKEVSVPQWLSPGLDTLSARVSCPEDARLTSAPQSTDNSHAFFIKPAFRLRNVTFRFLSSSRRLMTIFLRPILEMTSSYDLKTPSR